MKIQQLGSNRGATVGQMPKTLADKLTNLTLNEALQQGIIDDLGDEDGNFIKAHAEQDAYYAIVQGYAVRVSKAVSELDPEQLLEMAGDLTFSAGVGKPFLEDGVTPNPGEGVFWFRLGMPKGINLGETTHSLVANANEPVIGK